MKRQKHFSVILVAKAREIQRGLSDWEAIAVESSADDVEQIHLARERDLAVSKADRETRLLREVQAALDRIQQGSYGVCVECGEPIAEKRLNALPWASCCLSCQEARDNQPAQWTGGTELFAA